MKSCRTRDMRARDELTGDYIGFGPAGFSTFDKYKVVNPEAGSTPRYGYLAEKSVASEEWRTDMPSFCPSQKLRKLLLFSCASPYSHPLHRKQEVLLSVRLM